MAIGHFAFASNTNRFLACAPLADQPFAIAGVPYDGVVTNRPGARFGPQAIRAASLMLCDGIHPVFDVSPLDHLGDALDMRLPNASPLTRGARADRGAGRGADGEAPLRLSRRRPLGHAAAAARGPARATARRWPACISTPTATPGATISASPSGHGTWTYEAIQEGLISAPHTVQVGIRSSGERAAREYVADQGGQIFNARALRGLDGAGLAPVARRDPARASASAPAT